MIDIPKIEIEQQETEEFNAKDIFNKSIISIDEKLIPPPIAISCGETSYKGKLYPIPYASYGDISAIVGASKSKKTFLKSMLLSCYLGIDIDRFTDGLIKGHDNQKLVFDIDTEQSEYHSQRVFKRVGEMTGRNPDNFKGLALRKLMPKERFQLLEWLFNESEYKNDLGIVSIDGVADLVDDINDLKACNNVVNNLMKWSADTNSHIMTVIHRNFGSQKPTGHLGSAILKKCETVTFTEKDDIYTKVTSEYTRNIAFDNFAFEVRNDWLPYVVDNAVLTEDKNENPY
jgi:hypothetical protein